MARNTILIADDDEENRTFLKSLFQEDYTVAVTENGRQAMEFLMQNHQDVAILLLDMHMPVVDGRALLKVLKVKGVTSRIPVVMMTTTLDTELVKECYANGAVDFVMKPFTPEIVVGRVKNTIALYHSSAQLKGIIAQQTAQIKEKNKELKAFNDRLMEVMSSIVEFRNLESNAHIKKIKGISRILAETLSGIYGKEYNLPPEKVDIIESASALHDIGMIAIPDSILLKPGKLTADEFEVVKSHTTRGCEILEQIQELQSKEYIKVSYDICRHHHEKYDGSGYPDHLVGDAIPIEAQIVSIADVYDSLISDRAYRDAFDMDKAYSMITGGEAGVFSEKILDCFSRSRAQIESYCSRYSG
ncbi:MAG: response regulator [Lachnospiraceae bacterium]|nr:response regulator [Lachnospiraceae bacterium]